MRILSLFDGISCGQVALERAGIPVEIYYASEIDKYAIQITQKNYPNTIQLGDINNIDFTEFIGKVDLIMGGSPCQDLSIAGKRAGLQGERSGLFYKFVEALEIIKPKYFLLENVKMEKEYEGIITECLGVEPIEINSALVSAQNRKRLYWTNISGIKQPSSLNIFWCNICENNASENFYYTQKGLNWLNKYSQKTGKKLTIYKDADKVKMQMIEASHYKNYSAQRFFGIKDVKGLRYITPLECERCQTLPENYTEIGTEGKISNTQRYKCIGNGWTVDVIAHIFSFLEV